MTFAALRKTVIQATLFGLDWFAEDVTLRTAPGTESTARVKVEQETRQPQRGDRPSAMRDSDRPSAMRDSDGAERIRVVVCRDATFDGAVTDRPAVGSALIRSADKDPDVRPYTFTGECLAFCDTHATYVYHRARKQITTRG